MENEVYSNDFFSIQTRIEQMLLMIGVSTDGNFIDTIEPMKKEKYNISDAEIRATEYEFKKYKMEMKQYNFKSNLTRKAGAIERMRKSKENSVEVKSIKEVQKMLDNSHTKWMKCANKTQREYITNFIYRLHGIVIHKKVSKKKRVKKFMNTLNLDGNETNDTKNATGSKESNSGGGGSKYHTNEHKKKEIPELSEEAKEELKIAMENWKDKLYDNQEMIKYDPIKRQIDDMNLLPGGKSIHEDNDDTYTESMIETYEEYE